ncbi:UNVERIFIED_ORG: hypothetical protein GGE44_004104 [Rhizobium esperanzae]
MISISGRNRHFGHDVQPFTWLLAVATNLGIISPPCMKHPKSTPVAPRTTLRTYSAVLSKCLPPRAFHNAKSVAR